MRTHAAQIAFPGGAADPGDADLADTALREADEETGVDRTGIEVLGLLPPAHVAVSGFDVSGVVGWWARRSPVRAVDPREVASVLVVPVAELVDAGQPGPGAASVGLHRPGVRGRRPSDLGTDRPPARRRTGSGRLAAALGRAPHRSRSPARYLTRPARPRWTRCPLTLRRAPSAPAGASGEILPDQPEMGADLLRRYAEPHRRYHTPEHLHHVLAMIDELADEPGPVPGPARGVVPRRGVRHPAPAS